MIDSLAAKAKCEGRKKPCPPKPLPAEELGATEGHEPRPGADRGGAAAALERRAWADVSDSSVVDSVGHGQLCGRSGLTVPLIWTRGWPKGISEHVVGRMCSVYGPLNGNVRVTHSSLFIMANWPHALQYIRELDQTQACGAGIISV